MTDKRLIAVTADVAIQAADGEGKLPTFEVVAYTGEPVRLNGWDRPVVVDIDGMQFNETLIANLDHDSTKRVGHVTGAVKQDGKVLLSGVASAESASRDEVVGSGKNNYPWKASIEADPLKVTEIGRGKVLKANGREYQGPLYYVSQSLLTGFGFVTRGADKNAFATIAATAASNKERVMKKEVRAWAETIYAGLIDLDNATPEQIATIEANYAGQPAAKPVVAKTADPFEARKLEATRRKEIMEIADRKCDDYMKAGRADDIDTIRELADHAIEAGMSTQDFRLNLYESSLPMATGVPAARSRDRGLTDRVLQAAICEAGRLGDLEKQFTDQELQAAHDRFPQGISLNELFIVAAQANGMSVTGSRVTTDVQNAAFGMGNGPRIRASGGFSTINISNVVAATANKFMHEGWMAVDMTPLRIAAIRNVRNFQQITTVSLTGHLQFNKIGADGELKHGTLGDKTYTNQADTYGTMLAITRKDIINDDLGCLTAVPRRLGRGGALKLNDIFWTEFLGLVGASFFAAGNNNLNDGVADMTIGGLAATETKFLNQTDPDGKPLGIMPKIVLVPSALKATATALLDPQRGSSVLVTGASATIPNANVFNGRFQLESSPYISNSSYTGNTAVGWWMLADPNECPVIEIAALNGRVEPIVETADAAFNVLGVQMRGYSDIGVNEQEFRGGVYADGGAS